MKPRELNMVDDDEAGCEIQGLTTVPSQLSVCHGVLCWVEGELEVTERALTEYRRRVS